MSGSVPLLPQQQGRMFVADGGIETHLIFNEGFDFPYFTVFELLDREGGPEALRAYYAPYLDIARLRVRHQYLAGQSGLGGAGWL